MAISVGRTRPELVATAALVGCLIAYTASRNLNCSQDVRLIYPALIAFCALFGRALALYPPLPRDLVRLIAVSLLALGAAYFAMVTR